MKRNKTAKLVVALAATAALVSACSGDRGGEAVVPGSGDSGNSKSASSADVEFGTLASPCGDGDAKGATDQGVSDTEIKIGYGDDRGYAKSPGLNKEMSDAVSAMIKWCNEQGGINGRKIVGTDYDAAMTQANAVMQDACRSEFMMVATGSPWTRPPSRRAWPATWQPCRASRSPRTPRTVRCPTRACPFPVDIANASAWFRWARCTPT